MPDINGQTVLEEGYHLRIRLAKIIVVIGAVLVYVGHFLPWLSVDTMSLLSVTDRETAQYSVITSFEKLGIPWPMTPNPNGLKATVSVSGTHINIAWFYLSIILVLAAATVVPGRANQPIRVAVQSVAAVLAFTILVFVLGSGIGLMGVGFYLAAAGFVIIALTIIWSWIDREPDENDLGDADLLVD